MPTPFGHKHIDTGKGFSENRFGPMQNTQAHKSRTNLGGGEGERARRKLGIKGRRTSVMLGMPLTKEDEGRPSPETLQGPSLFLAPPFSEESVSKVRLLGTV